jgi:hypothetical protein
LLKLRDTQVQLANWTAASLPRCAAISKRTDATCAVSVPIWLCSRELRDDAISVATRNDAAPTTSAIAARAIVIEATERLVPDRDADVFQTRFGASPWTVPIKVLLDLCDETSPVKR